MKLPILALTVASAAAFAPSKDARSTTALNGSPESPDGLGVLPPLGLFDPLGLVNDAEGFPRRRAVEIKHGRIAMAAFVGMIFQETGVTFPAGSLDLKGDYPISEVLSDGMGFPALTHIPVLGLAQILLFAGLAELVAIPAYQYTGGPQDLPGGYDGAAGRIPGGYPGQTQITDPEKRDRALNVEIQNGRAAMMGVTGAMMHSCLDSCDHHFFYPLFHN
mmetsp:Transcript_7588/g.21076  ORF Transcript_7588/g.21076 Transcript_7588/m.21076 type:complete len:219 (-) Transcript_7588:127-783(-)|eukprot:CAMPEP_0168733732 /NCGR_PEP_ID=MMETSP0724-20121128/8446_1 /TAXON_ID=265536 /ORGANISM="Amphiprora sp., Strain CCMP467" /LENGTH=218 /DNA_ID=CAMNT_0008780807 /DNA_START=171 /DNA_END=827 /DNA_ORIENTATION=+